MNETILSGLLNLFAIFASLAKIERRKAQQAVNTYLTSHFGIQSNQTYIDLFNEAQSMYDDPDFIIDKEQVIINVCAQLKVKLVAEEQILLLLRFMEFAHGNSEGLQQNIKIFHKIAEIFGIQPESFDCLVDFVVGKEHPNILFIDADKENKGQHANHIYREWLSGEIRVLNLEKYDKLLFSHHGEGVVYMNNIPVCADTFYAWQRSGVIKGKRFSPIYFSDVMEVFNKDEKRPRVYLTGRDIDFHFDNSENGLHNFSFNLESGQLVAIMGGSGVGKSTLLSILNGNITPQKGAILVNGIPLSDPDCKRQIGFVPQDDLLIEELTVFQNLWYTARFCFADQSDEAIEQKVNAILEDLDLLKIKDLPVGSPIRKTISGGQRKRLNIALELIREPGILYLDEPTSGLSSSDSEKVIILLKEQTHRGKLVIVNIHQPSSEIYKLFDRLWLLDTGGYPIYDGNPIEAITYFKRIANFADQDISVCETCGNVNPELILNIIDAKKIDDSGNQTNIRKLTAKEWHELYLSSRPEMSPVERKELPPNTQKKPSAWQQFRIFLERNIKTKITNRQYLGIALLETPILALIVALLTRYAPDGEYSLLENKNLLSYIFMAVIVATFTGLSISAEEIIKDRALLKRERFLQLSRSSYLLSKMFYLLVISGLQSLLFIAVGNSLMGIGGEMFMTWWLILWATSFLANLTGLLLSQTLNSIVAIYISIPLLLIPQILLCGVVVKFDDLSQQASRENVVPLIGELIPSRWAFEALATEQFKNNAYNQYFFPIEREKFLAQYYQNIHVKEVEGLVNSLNLENEDKKSLTRTILNELDVLGKAARIEPFDPSKEDYESYLRKAENALKQRADNFTALLTKRTNELIQAHSSEWLTELKKNHHNTFLQDQVLNNGSVRFCVVGKDRIYPKIGQIYLRPDRNTGQAPFYSGEKKVAGLTFTTFSFNLFVLGIFAILVIIFIFAEIPGKYINKNQ